MNELALPERETTLRDYWRVVVRRKTIVIVALLIAVAGAVGLSLLQEPIYAGESQMLVEPRSGSTIFEDNTELNVQNLDRAIQTEIQVLEAQGVRQRVQEDLGLDRLPPQVMASPIGSTDVVRVIVRSADPGTAQILADSYVQAYISERREQAVSDRLAIGSEVELRIAEVDAQIDDIDQQIADAPDDERATLAATLASERNGLVSQRTTLDQRLNDLRVEATLSTGGASVVKDAELPTDPVEPTPVRTAALAAIVGLLIGLGAAFLIDYVDDSVRSGADLEAVTSIPVLAVVPVDPPPDQRPIAISRPSDFAVETYRGLRTNVQFLGLDSPMKVVQITSSLPGEGKTTTATNLAIVLAQAGRRVVLIDADLRKPRIAEIFSAPQRPGLTDLLLGDPIDLCLTEVDEGLQVITSGLVPPNPSEMLASERTRTVLSELAARFDHVIVDSAPVLPVADPLALAGSADGVLLITQAGRTSKRNLAEAIDRLGRVQANVVGIVLNRVSSGRGEGAAYGYGYGYGYGSGYGSGSDADRSAEPARESSEPAAPRRERHESDHAPELPQRSDEPA